MNKTYKKLLQIGQRKLKGSVLNDVEDHVRKERERLDDLYQINQYVYTYYSTNDGDDTMSLEFVCLRKHASQILLKCKQRGFWYVAKRFDDSPVNVQVDKNTYADTKTVTQQVTNISKLHMKTSQNPEGWEIDHKEGSTYHLVRQVSIHLLDPSYVQNLLTEYATSEIVEDWWKEQIEEASDDLTETEFMNLIPHLAIITVEDPRVGQTTLYKDVLEILRDKARKTRKTRSL